MSLKKRVLQAGAGLALAGFVTSVNTTEAEAASWQPRTVSEIQSEIQTQAEGQDGTIEYTFKYGDTLWGISEATDISVDKLAQINDIENSSMIVAGNSIYLSNNKNVVSVEKGDRVESYDVSEEKVKKTETPKQVEEKAAKDTPEENTAEQEAAEQAEVERQAAAEQEAAEQAEAEEQAAAEQEAAEQAEAERQAAAEQEAAEQEAAERAEAAEQEAAEQAEAERQAAAEQEEAEQETSEEDLEQRREDSRREREQERIEEEELEERREQSIADRQAEREAAEQQAAEEEAAQQEAAEQQAAEEEAAQQEAAEQQAAEEEAAQQEAAEQQDQGQPQAQESDNGQGEPSGSSEGYTMSVNATAYSTNQASLSDTTATGINLHEQPNVVAVDPDVIPLGSTIEIPGIGTFVAGDTGGAINGNRIDIHTPSVDQALGFGRQNMEIQVTPN